MDRLIERLDRLEHENETLRERVKGLEASLESLVDDGVVVARGFRVVDERGRKRAELALVGDRANDTRQDAPYPQLSFYLPDKTEPAIHLGLFFAKSGDDSDGTAAIFRLGDTVGLTSAPWHSEFTIADHFVESRKPGPVLMQQTVRIMLNVPHTLNHMSREENLPRVSVTHGERTYEFP